MKKMLCFFATLCMLITASTRSNAQSIESYFIAHSYDVCGTYFCRVTSSGYVPGQTVRIYWGDGSDTTVLTTSWITDTAITTSYHPYAAPGIYTIKMVLYDGGPVDSATVSQDVQPCNFISLGAMVDVNANCIQDTADNWVHGSCAVEIDSAGVPVDTLPMYASMWYKASAPGGTIYTLRMLSPPPGLALACSSSGIIYDTIPATPFSLIPYKYLLFDCTSTSSAFDLDISASFRSSLSGGGMHMAVVSVSNTACTGTPALVTFDFSPKYSFGSIEPAYSHTVSGSSVTIDVGTISAHAAGYMYIYLNPAVTLTAGDTVNSVFTLTPITGDLVPANNIVNRCDTIISSFDPNHKSVTPTGDISPGTALEYMLEFENTGTDTAHNIHIMDTLSDHLDVNTLKGGNSSHRVSLYRYSNAGHNILKFDFPYIMLPDSSHHDVCRGMVTFSINAKTTLSPGTTIANRVGIYFDANEVVMTNTVFSKTPLTTTVKSVGMSKVELYPNPVGDILNIIAESGSYRTLTIYNVMGQLVRSQELNGTTVSVKVSSLVPGIYYVSLRGEGESKTVKFEKQ